MHPCKGVYEAGGSEKAGRVMEPRKEYSRGQEESPQEVLRGKPTVSSGRKAAVLGATWQASRTPPGSENEACIHRGSLGTWESHLSPCHIPGLGHRVPKGPGVAWTLPPRHEPLGDTTNGRKQARYREASDERSDPRRAWWQSERRIVPKQVGNQGPRDPREGRRRRASR
jgi:hypothetical protein